MKYPIGIQTFEQIINGEYVYVDKTELIYKLVASGKVYFLGDHVVSERAFLYLHLRTISWVTRICSKVWL